MRHPSEAAALDDERWVKARLAAAAVPQPSPELLSCLAQLGQPDVRRVPSPGSLRPRGRADGVGPGRSAGQAPARSHPGGAGPGRRVRNRCIAAAGLAASVIVGLGSGGLGSGGLGSGGGGGTAGIADPPTPPRPSPAVEVSVVGPGTFPVQLRPYPRTALSVVYRRP